jgi:hypothetical protein
MPGQTPVPERTKEGSMRQKDLLSNLEKNISGAFCDIKIPFLQGRPEREQVIGHDDWLNLQIALHTAEDLDELLRSI